MLKQDGNIFYGWNALAGPAGLSENAEGQYGANWIDSYEAMQMPWLYSYAALPAGLH